MMKYFYYISACILLVGCGDPSIYYWKGYDDQVYQYYQGKPLEEQIQALEEIKVSAAGQDKPLPPTFYAHLGLLYQKAGQTLKFKELMEAEKRAFPESTKYNEFLLRRFR